MLAALEVRGIDTLAVHVRALSQAFARDWLGGLLAEVSPDVILNATAFAASSPGEVRAERAAGGQRLPDPPDHPRGRGSGELEEFGAWPRPARSRHERGAAEEVDKRRSSPRAVAFKATERFDAVTECGIVAPRIVLLDRVAFVADLAANWASLRRTPPKERRVALVLANYPNRDGRIGNGVGLDTPSAGRRSSPHCARRAM